jgi:hypothetical protein
MVLAGLVVQPVGAQGPAETNRASVPQQGGSSIASPLSTFGLDLHAMAFGALSQLGSTTSHCSDVVDSIRQINPALPTTCSFPNRTGSWGIGAGIGFTSFASFDVRYHVVRKLTLTATAPIDTTTTINSTLDFGPFHNWELVAVGAIPIGPLVPFFEAGAARWHLETAADLNIIHNGQKAFDAPSGTADDGWSPLWGAGIRFRLGSHVAATVGYERVMIRKDQTLREHYDEIRVGITVGTRP